MLSLSKNENYSHFRGFIFAMQYSSKFISLILTVFAWLDSRFDYNAA